MGTLGRSLSISIRLGSHRTTVCCVSRCDILSWIWTHSLSMLYSLQLALCGTVCSPEQEAKHDRSMDKDPGYKPITGFRDSSNY